MRASDTIMSLLVISILATTAFAVTTPEGPFYFNATESTRRIPAPAQSIKVQAGNVTELVISGTSVTAAWAGFYGNITGVLKLDDELNNTLFDWTVTRPKGEIYASEDTITWSLGNIDCYNYSMNNLSYLHHTEYEPTLGIGDNDADGINETFMINRTHRSFYAGPTLIDGSTAQAAGGKACPAVSLYGSSGQDNSIFQEVLLYDYISNKPIYTALIEQTPQEGFNQRPWDFEMILGVDGHNGSQQTKTYYFYLELG